MISLKTHRSDGSEFQVYDEDRLIGHILLRKGPSGNRYFASLKGNGSRNNSGKEFDSPDDALRRIGRNR